MNFTKKFGMLTLALGAMTMATGAQAADDLKIGVVIPMSGPFASHGKQMTNGLNLFLAQNGDTVAGRKVKLIIKDDTGVAPAVAKRQAQELLIKDKVDILAGFDLTPNAMSVAHWPPRPRCR